MKTYSNLAFLVFVLFSLIITSCTREDDVMDDVTEVLPCEVIGGDYNTDIVLINRNNNPDVADYCVNAGINMVEGAGIIIEEGVVIEFAVGTFLQLGKYSDGGFSNGYIIADGTATNPIVFRGTANTPGIWNGIQIGCGSSDIRNSLNHCIVEYAGNTSNGYGIKIPSCSNGSSGLLSITNTTIRHSLGHGLYTEGEDCINSFSNNIFNGNSQDAIRMHAQDFSHVGSETVFTNNGTNGVVGIEGVFGGRIWDDFDHTWHKLNNGAFYLNSHTYITNGSLSIQPGTEIVVGNGLQLAIEGSSYINAIGTSSEPIVFRGLNPGSPSWNAIYLGAHNTPNVIEHCNISEAGVGIIRSSSCVGEAAIGLDYWFGSGARATIRNCNIFNSEACGIYTALGNMSNLTQSGNTFSGNMGDDICN